jgi:S-DNA-T family DNA segregation ATPase FtsK/SpoIIIE
MLEPRNLKVDLFALGVLALTIFLAAAVFSYDPADPPSKLVYPERVETLNACGRSGALVSNLLFTTIGLGAYYLLFSLALLDAALLTRRTISDPILRVVGWLLSLVGFSTLAAMALPQWSPGPVIGCGGYLGAAGQGLLETSFASVGAYILTLSLVLVGLLLCTDYLLIHLLIWVLRKPVAGVGRGMLHVAAAYAQHWGLTAPSAPRRKATAGDDALAVRISGRAAEQPALAATQAAEAPDDEEQAEPPEEQAEPDSSQPKLGAASGRGPLASMLRIRKPKREAEREKMIEQIEAASRKDNTAEYELPSTELLLPGEPLPFAEQEKDVRRKAKILEKTFADFGFNIRVVEIQTGPVIAQFEVELEAGLRLSRITGLSEDLAIALRVPSVRIVAPIPGKNTVGIEVPNSERQLVRMREVMDEANGKAQKMRIPLYLGKDVAGNPMVADLASLPHLLIAGRTGTGKSVCLNTIIVSILMTRRPDEVRMLLIDPKMVELSPYRQIPHLMHPVVTDMRKAEAILAWAVEKMEERYALLARAGVRHISVYNQLGEEELMERVQPEGEEERQMIPRQMPYIVVVADEMADLMMTAAKEVEGHIIRLAQKSRAVGIHLVLATQKPTVDVITGLIKSNLPARISFQVSSRTDSRVVLDEMGADKLLGNGDMLFLWPGTSTLIRGQGTYLSDDEINSVIASVATTEPQFVHELVHLKTTEETAAGTGQPQLNSRDDLYEAAVDIVIREGRGSVSLLQRTLGIGYGRAARLVDFMAEDGIVGNYNGSQAREILITLEQWAVMQGESSAGPVPSKPAPLEPPAPRRPAARILIGAPEPPQAALSSAVAEEDTGGDSGTRGADSGTRAGTRVKRPRAALATAKEELDDESQDRPVEDAGDEEDEPTPRQPPDDDREPLGDCLRSQFDDEEDDEEEDQDEDLGDEEEDDADADEDLDDEEEEDDVDPDEDEEDSEDQASKSVSRPWGVHRTVRDPSKVVADD